MELNVLPRVQASGIDPLIPRSDRVTFRYFPDLWFNLNKMVFGWGDTSPAYIWIVDPVRQASDQKFVGNVLIVVPASETVNPWLVVTVAGGAYTSLPPQFPVGTG
ncbi:hypothetical protein CE91St62_36620 [Lachnospiraceae bacterium]|uniref:hypothetical protein n=1 Tax=Extibacter sp. GGCC_0201 TaxID=2731209 RepID=UPI001AA1979B|nr:hypothetical protein [Extibacter sp. GGCC_0201]MBO1719977.1 hypothetical protein [Extibacter sp. GGCC_0201]BDF35599.1 hypothetical protein CE91St61_36740 [Lachnospiraceae bacterium]BDF39601.1 hypothetical protein CE91St62_36620 [Lachnospiraceae bacterium]